ncbi:MAG: HD domain-containing protein [Alphaproteobacteria bacterium]|nr:HD domain-containing protein [Alphaproteobacteria bacterium]
MPVIGFRFAVLGALLGIVNIALAVVLVIVHQANVEAARQTAVDLFGQIGAKIEEQIQSSMNLAMTTADVVSNLRDLSEPQSGSPLEHPAFGQLRAIQKINPSLYSLYVGYEDGGFLQLIAVRNKETVIKTINAPEGTQEARRIIQGQGAARVELWAFTDDAGKVLGVRRNEAPAYDPRQRPWFATAKTADDTFLSDPYIFNSQPKPGITVSRRMKSGQGVAGVDIALDGLSQLAASQKISANGRVILTDAQNHVLGASDDVLGTSPPLTGLADISHPLAKLASKHASQKDEGIVSDGKSEFLSRHFRWQGSGKEINIHVLAPFDDFAGHIRRIDSFILLFSLLVVGATIPAGIWVARQLSKSIVELAGDAERIRELDFTGEVPPPTPIREIQTLTAAFAVMKKQILERTRLLGASQETLRRLIELGISLGAESSSGQLSETALAEAMRLTGAEGGTLYIRHNEKRLQLAIIRNSPLELSVGGRDGDDMELPELDLWNPDDDTPIRDNFIADAVHGGQVIAIDDVRSWTKHDMQGVIEFDEVTGYETKSMLIIPLTTPNGDVIGVLQLINMKAEGGNFSSHRSASQRHVMALASQVAVALQNRVLIKAQENLIDGMVDIISSAIDTKSPYTAGHASRLMEIAVMLADEAGKSQEDAFSDYEVPSRDARRELRTAALLHDCGKVTTPEYVVDKATKLETIHNRLHEIRTRFEVLLRDAEIDRLRALADGEDEDAANQAFAERRDELQDDFAFVAQCNVGAEQMHGDDIERLKRIGTTTWLRYFDDRLGLSVEELRRLKDAPAPPIPAVEPLLSDRPEHRIPWTGREKFHDPSWKFALSIPRVMYDRGEIYNLSISRGTLTAEERFKINEHAIQGVVMLNSMSFPAQLRNVPEIAGAHHEAINGKGYPRGIKKDDMSVSARILAIADIFEALTAADRPYKKPKSLSESIDILAGFRDRQHIDPDLFALFLRTGVYRRYAESFLQPEQIDAVDIEKHLN